MKNLQKGADRGEGRLPKGQRSPKNNRCLKTRKLSVIWGDYNPSFEPKRGEESPRHPGGGGEEVLHPGGGGTFS